MIAAARLLPDVRFVLAGEGTLREEWMREAPSNVEFPGFVKDATAFFAKLDVFVMPSRSEAWGLAAIEAMAHGVPVIASGVQGLAEIIEVGRTGWLVPQGDVETLARTIEDAKCDEDRLDRYRVAGRARAASFGVEKMPKRQSAFTKKSFSTKTKSSLVYRSSADGLSTLATEGLRMKSALWSIAVMSLALMTAPAASATTFTFSLTIGSGNASGSITTDGTLGFLTAANLTDWNIFLAPVPGTPVTLEGPASGNNSEVEIFGDTLFTTSTGLFMDFANAGYALFQGPNIGSGVNFLCFAGDGQLCGGFMGPAITMSTDVFGANVQEAGGRFLISGEIDDTVVPEPSSMILLSAGFAGLAALRLRKRSA
ncbi:MAG: glycosyltransferase [Acidobacteriota bacterium]